VHIQIAPDGHCLFAAVADQLSLHGIIPRAAASYAATRATAAHYMMQHRDDFLPFLPSIDGEDGAGATQSEGMMSQREFQMYCASIRDTAAWGGEPEIMALSRVYNVPIHVIQAGQPPVVIHEPPYINNDLDGKIVFISYHRRMYGLGEVSRRPPLDSWSTMLNRAQPQHYNSLRPKSKLPTVIRSALR
jgi:OTU domain-containing protein 6